MQAYRKYLIGVLLGLMALVLVKVLPTHAEPPAQADNSIPPAIVGFDVDFASVPLADVEAGDVTAVFSWETLFFDETYALELDAFRLDGWQAVPETLDNTSGQRMPILANGELEIQLQHPLNFGRPTYRLAIVDKSDNTLVDQQILTIPYEVEQEVVPTVDLFASLNESVSQAALVDGSARVQVNWRVLNRVPGSRLIFSQLLDDAELNVLNIELPRTFLWIPSEGAGLVAPRLPIDGETVRLRLSVVDTQSDTVYASQVIELAVSDVQVQPATPTPTGGAPATPAPTAVGTSTFEVRSFNASPSPIERGGTVNISWDVSGTYESMTLFENQAGSLEFPHLMLQNPPSTGSYVFRLPTTYPERVDFTLLITSGGREYRFDKSVIITCPFENILISIPGRCPSTQATFSGAIQFFERGAMLWRADIDEIYILYNSRLVDIYTDPYIEGEELTYPAEPPTGMVAPIRGFGKIWTTNSTVQSSLGWATSAELGAPMTIEVYAGMGTTLLSTMINIGETTYVIQNNRWSTP